jgi:predicted esterase
MEPRGFSPGDTSMILVPATIHGRVLIERDEDAAVSLRLLVGFHGYGQSAADMMEELRQIPGSKSWTRVSIQALNRFYTRGDAKVVASWMTREDRDQAIADNIAYVDSAIAHAVGQMEPPAEGQMEPPGFGLRARLRPTAEALAKAVSPGDTARAEARALHVIVLAGFSQGVAMAYRAALLGSRPVDGIIALAGDLPPELKTDTAHLHPWPKVLIGVGHLEQWYSSERVADDESFLASRGVDHSVVRFKGGHQWTEEFRAAAGSFLAALHVEK